MNGIIYITHDKGRDFKYQRKRGNFKLQICRLFEIFLTRELKWLLVNFIHVLI